MWVVVVEVVEVVEVVVVVVVALPRRRRQGMTHKAVTPNTRATTAAAAVRIGCDGKEKKAYASSGGHGHGAAKATRTRALHIPQLCGRRKEETREKEKQKSKTRTRTAGEEEGGKVGRSERSKKEVGELNKKNEIKRPKCLGREGGGGGRYIFLEREGWWRLLSLH